mmetsp:Transcript_55077/g.83350  ORF Transcript_55077/g.83350 Transcript_55077/m.83350 type:complete len:103 (-) Transcript_55077:11-319(-)
MERQEMRLSRQGRRSGAGKSSLELGKRQETKPWHEQGRKWRSTHESKKRRTQQLRTDAFNFCVSDAFVLGVEQRDRAGAPDRFHPGGLLKRRVLLSSEIKVM